MKNLRKKRNDEQIEVPRWFKENRKWKEYSLQNKSDKKLDSIKSASKQLQSNEYLNKLNVWYNEEQRDQS